MLKEAFFYLLPKRTSAEMQLRKSDTSVSDYIQSIYLDILCRRASVQEVEHQVRDWNGYRPLFETAMHSEEYRQIVDRYRADRKPINLTMDGAETVEHVVSLGSHCITSALLKRWSLKRWSGPLDWTFSSTGMVAACIEDRFETLLDNRQFAFVHDPKRTVDEGDSYCEHLLYRERFGVESVFNHRDPRVASNYAAYERAAARVNKILDDGSRALFVCITTLDRTSKEALLQLAFALRERSKGAKLLHVLVRPNDQGSALPKSELIHRTKNLTAFDFYSLSHMGPVDFPNPLDELFMSALVHENKFALIS